MRWVAHNRFVRLPGGRLGRRCQASTGGQSPRQRWHSRPPEHVPATPGRPSANEKHAVGGPFPPPFWPIRSENQPVRWLFRALGGVSWRAHYKSVCSSSTKSLGSPHYKRLCIVAAMPDFHTRLKKARTHAALSQSDLARRLGVKPQTIRWCISLIHELSTGYLRNGS